NYAGGHIKLNPRRSKNAIEEKLCDELDMDVIEASKLIKRTVDANMANGIAKELRTRGYEPEDFTVLAYGGNGPLHACGIANALGVTRILAPPFAAVFSAVGAGSTMQMHIHELNTWTVLFDANKKSFFSDYQIFNENVAELERRGREDLVRQGFDPEDISYRLELDMRYGNQRVQTAVVTELHRLSSQHDVLKLIGQFDKRYGERFGEGSQATEAGVRINTVRVCSFVDRPGIPFQDIKANGRQLPAPASVSQRPCHFVGQDKPVTTPIYDETALLPGTMIEGPAVIVTKATTYLVEPGWRYQAAAMGAVWFSRIEA
ncbi:MAG: hydantoinase/oxoprolinase family protein, partial [Proteobacteria bacterium]|nr:hydantoinase/oxoprolinase family protein [Pseudomonadota bacterium]